MTVSAQTHALGGDFAPAVGEKARELWLAFDLRSA
jgi:hypothetical protein